MAATVDVEAAEAVRTGRLTQELAPASGFEAVIGNVPAGQKRNENGSEVMRLGYPGAQNHW